MPPLSIDIKELKEKASGMKERIKQREKERILSEKAKAIRQTQNKDTAAGKGKLHQIHQLDVMYNLKTKDDLKNFAQVNSKTYDTTTMAKMGKQGKAVKDGKKVKFLLSDYNGNVLPNQETVEVGCVDDVRKLTPNNKATNFAITYHVNSRSLMRMIEELKKAIGREKIYIKKLEFSCYENFNDVDFSISELEKLSRIDIYLNDNLSPLKRIIEKLKQIRLPYLEVVKIKTSGSVNNYDFSQPDVFNSLKSIKFYDLPKIIIEDGTNQVFDLEKFIKERAWLTGSEDEIFSQRRNTHIINLNLEIESLDDIDKKIEKLNEERQDVLIENKLSHINIISLRCGTNNPSKDFQTLELKEFENMEEALFSINASDIENALNKLIELRKDGYIKLLDNVEFNITDSKDIELIRRLIQIKIKKENYMYLPMSTKIKVGNNEFQFGAINFKH